MQRELAFYEYTEQDRVSGGGTTVKKASETLNSKASKAFFRFAQFQSDH